MADRVIGLLLVPFIIACVGFMTLTDDAEAATNMAVNSVSVWKEAVMWGIIMTPVCFMLRAMFKSRGEQ